MSTEVFAEGGIAKATNVTTEIDISSGRHRRDEEPQQPWMQSEYYGVHCQIGKNRVAFRSWSLIRLPRNEHPETGACGLVISFGIRRSRCGNYGPIRLSQLRPLHRLCRAKIAVEPTLENQFHFFTKDLFSPPSFRTLLSSTFQDTWGNAVDSYE
jgi:hypothetical protein